MSHLFYRMKMWIHCEKILWSLLAALVLGWQPEASAEDISSLPELQAPAAIEPSAPPPAFAQVAEFGLIRGLVEFPVYSFYLGLPDVYGVAYVPNFSTRLGMQVLWKEMGMTLSAALPIPKEELDRRGQSDQFSFLLSRYWRQHGLDVYLQNYRGFYVASPLTEFRLNRPEKYPQLPDAEITNYGFNYYQVLNPERYSLKAAFSQMEKQLVSGGSFLWTFFYNHLQMSRGNKFILGSEPDAIQAPPQLESGIFDTAGLGGGYGHTWLLDPWAVSVQGIAGVGAQHQQISETEDELGSLTTVAVKMNANAAAAYNYKNYSFGGKILLDTLLSDIRGTQVYSTLLNVLFFFGGRF